MRLTKGRSGLLIAGLLCGATTARADITYTVNYTGFNVNFFCDPYLTTANCSVNNGVVTLFNNGGSLSFQATALSGSFVTSPSSSISFPLLTFTSTVNGPFATWPVLHDLLFSFTAAFSLNTIDGTQGVTIGGGFYRDPANNTGHIAIQGVQFSPPSSSLPGSYRVSGGVTSPPILTFGVTPSSGTVFGSASIAPEPSTVVLSASGLGLVGLVGLRRRRRSE
jgi:hypothetical protein